MTAATLQAKIYSGYAKAAARIGYTTDLYRPTSASNPLDPINKQQSFPASFNAEDMKYGKPAKYGKPGWYGLFDGTQTKVGDYLTNDNDGTFFIAAMQTMLPIFCVKCNTTVKISRAAQSSSVGSQGYGGNTLAGETPLMTNWPASILQGTKGEKSETNLPGDTRMAWWIILMPAYAGVLIENADIIEDENGLRYVISSAELTDLGWRMTAQLAVT